MAEEKTKKENKRAQRPAFNTQVSERLYFSGTDIASWIGTSQRHLHRRTQMGQFPGKTNIRGKSFYNIEEVIRSLVKKNTTEPDAKDFIEFEKLKKIQLENKIAYGLAVPTEDAIDRMRTALHAVRGAIKQGSKEAALMMTDPPPNRAEKIILLKYNRALKILKQESELKDWEEDVENAENAEIKDKKVA